MTVANFRRKQGLLQQTLDMQHATHTCAIIRLKCECRPLEHWHNRSNCMPQQLYVTPVTGREIGESTVDLQDQTVDAMS